MDKKLTREQKAWVTRKTNVKKLMKAHEAEDLKIGDILRIKLPNDYIVKNGPAMISLSKALDNSLDKLEQRMADYIARIDRILA